MERQPESKGVACGTRFCCAVSGFVMAIAWNCGIALACCLSLCLYMSISLCLRCLIFCFSLSIMSWSSKDVLLFDSASVTMSVMEY